MEFQEPPQLPLTARRKWLVGAGVALFALQVVAASWTASVTTDNQIDGGWALGMMALSLPLSVTAVLLLVRQADLPDVGTAAFLVTISPYAAFTLSAAIAARGTQNEVNLVDALFLGVTVGAFAALIVWGCALAIARMLRLSTARELTDAG